MNNDQNIKDAQYRKGLSIAFFNATNAAVEFAKRIPVGTPSEFVMEEVRKYREQFLQDHANYYASVIARIGANYDPVATAEKLTEAKTLPTLRAVWQSLSEDERQDDNIIKVKNECKAKLEKPKKIANEKAL